jgi:hypothetical protein
MIAIVISEYNCDDTYYACFDPATGRFSVDIPDDCCGYGYGDGCNLCPTPSKTPLVIAVTFDGITKCPECKISGQKNVIDIDINDTFLLTQIAGLTCNWESGIIGTVTNTHPDSGTECGSDNPVELDITIEISKDTRSPYNTHILMRASTLDLFSSYSLQGSNCLSGIYNSTLDISRCGYNFYLAYGGTATIEELA